MGRCTDWEGRDRYHIFSSVAVDVAVDESNISSVDQDSSTLLTQEMHPELAFRELLPFWGDGMWLGTTGCKPDSHSARSAHAKERYTSQCLAIHMATCITATRLVLAGGLAVLI